jgi:hypothetical protein
MNILVIDGQGGGIGAQLIYAIKEHLPGHPITAVGTNTAATAAMIKAGAGQAATGENAVMVGCRRADAILGPVGIAIADSLLGEVTPAMAVAVGQSGAKKILIPTNHCGHVVVGVADYTVARLIQGVVETLKDMLG